MITKKKKLIGIKLMKMTCKNPPIECLFHCSCETTIATLKYTAFSLLMHSRRPGKYQVVLGDYDRSSLDGSEVIIDVSERHLVSVLSSKM